MLERQILLAEEDAEHSAQLQEYLHRLHYSVELHSSGLTALQRLQEPDTPVHGPAEFFASANDRA